MFIEVPGMDEFSYLQMAYICISFVFHLHYICITCLEVLRESIAPDKGESCEGSVEGGNDAKGFRLGRDATKTWYLFGDHDYEVGIGILNLSII